MKAIEGSRVTFSEQEFRKTLGLFPTGVVIVTTLTAAGERLGITVSSFNSVSLAPPLVLFSIARSAYGLPAWAQAQSYAINVLSETQDGLSTRFAKSLADKWNAITPLAGETGAPILANALAAFECVPYAHYDGGDHLIMVGRVVAIRRMDMAGRRPLIFCGGRYRCLDLDEPELTPSEDSLWLHGW